MILKAWVTGLIMVLAFLGSTVGVEASEPGQNPMTIFLVDGSAVRQNENDIDTVRSLISMMSAVGGDREVAFIDTERPSFVVGPTSLESTGFAEAIALIDSELISESNETPDLFTGLVEANTLIGLERPALGSNVVLITSGSSTDNTTSVYKRVITLVDQLVDNSINLHVITIGSTSDATKDFSNSLVSRSGGEYFVIQKQL